MGKRCISINPKVKELTKQLVGETDATVIGLIELWQDKNNKDWDTYPTAFELNNFRAELRKGSHLGWARTASNSYEVSTRGDKRFSALVAKFDEGTTIDSVDVGGRTIEEVYQTVIKRSRKGQAPSKDSKLNLLNSDNFSTTFKNLPEGVINVFYSADDTIPRVIFKAPNGEIGQITYKNKWEISRKQRNSKGEDVFYGETMSPEDVDKIVSKFIPNKFREYAESGKINEDNSKDFQDNKGRVKQFFRENYNIHLINEYFFERGKHETFEDFSYYEGYLPLWQEWARQNPKLINELRNKSAGKTLTDQFANTRVSQARALAEILNETSSQETTEMLDNVTEDTENSGEIDTASFEANISTPQEQAKADLTLGVAKKRDRITLITRLFSTTMDQLVEDSKGTETRLGIINKYTPYGIFKIVESHFSNYLKDSMEQRIAAKFDSINKQKGALNYSEEQRMGAAKKQAEYTTNEYQLIIDNFKVLAEEASLNLIESEGIRIDPYAMESTEIENEIQDTSSDVIDPNSSDTPGNRDLFSIETAFKDNWMTNYTLVSSFDSLSQKVRKTLKQIPKLSSVPKNGKYYQEKDDLGYPRFLDVSYVHAILIKHLRFMETSADLIPMLDELSVTQPWVKQVSILLQKDPVLLSQFYQHFRKDFISYWVQKKKNNADGSYYTETVEVNASDGIASVVDDWRYNYENGNKLHEDSVYDNAGKLNLDKADIGLDKVVKLNDKLNKLTKAERYEVVKNDNFVQEIVDLLNMLGINPTNKTLKDALALNKDTNGISFTDPIMSLLPSLNVIFSGISKGKVKDSKGAEGQTIIGDLINTFSSAYKSIANMFLDTAEGGVESSVRENGKSNYSHVAPNFMGRMVNRLQGNRRSEQEYQDMLEEQYGQYEFFKQNGVFLNDWLKQLSENPALRKEFKHKKLLNANKVEYAKWDDLDYMIVLLSEYAGDPGNGTSNIKFTNFHLPMLADAQSAEFLRFRKIDNHSEMGDDGKFRKFDDVLLDKMSDTVVQEFNRIALVVKRDKARLEGKPGVEAIKNYDIVRDKKDPNKILNLGGAKFHFFPALNDLKVNGQTFIKKLKDTIDSGTPKELKSLLRESLEVIMNEEFENTYREWHEMGLLDENENGVYKHMGILGISKGQSSFNKPVIRAMGLAKSKISNWTNSMENLSKALSANKAINTNDANRVLEQLKERVLLAVTEGQLTLREAESINRELELKNNAKEALREYFWNSTFATSQIIQLTATDLAYYNGLIDFQKRYKQVHSPALRLNTSSKYGRKIERTLTLKDSEIVSPSLKNIEEILQNRVDENTMTRGDMLYILEKFKEVNWADAQAYRSLGSYRAILDMSGQWTDEMQVAFDNIQNDTYSADDFDIIWQTKKPFVYSHMSKESGIKGEGPIKLGVQHKNSEFLLLAAHQLVASALSNSPKLKALNKFMEDRQIDVVQFQSAVKVGLQGVQNINDLQTEKEVTNHLNKVLGIDGQENKNVLHEISYEDYGIQVETPEHSIDAVQLIGTQIRKLVGADMSDNPDFRLTVNGVELTKQEWLDKYNEVNTENILQAFADLNEKFSDIKEVEKMLQYELRGNSRYGSDIIRACTLNKDGVFNIPLFDPVISTQVQTLLNSIIKKNITKQKIRGGALIQVSSYGLSDDLEIVFEGEGKNKRIKYLEVYMPAYSREFYEPLMKEGSNELDITKLPESLRKLIGYRVPTEDKYSMAPLYIKGFLPQQNGSAIMLPAEITTLSGSDFDVDKLYIMLPEFRKTAYYNKSAFINDLIITLNGPKEGTTEHSDMVESIKESIKNGRTAEEGTNDNSIYKTYMENREKYRDSSKDKLEKIEFDMNRPASEQSKKARNNMIIDMMWGVLTNSDTASKILNPGGFDAQKKAGSIVTILKNNNKESLKRELGITRDAEIAELLTNSDMVDKLAKKYETKRNPLNPQTQVYLHQQNMMGASLISIYANHNASHALMQNTELSLHPSYGAFTLNGKKLISLHSIMNSEKEFISKNTAGFLAAAVDNAKEAILAMLNQNTFTADASMMLSRLGYTPLEISVFMNQPVVLEITHKFFRETRDGKTKNEIFDEVLEGYRVKAQMPSNVNFSSYQDNKFNLNDLMLNILNREDGSNITASSQTNDGGLLDYNKDQLAVGYLFRRMMSSSDSLSLLVMATRADSQNGAAGPTIADTQITLTKWTDFYDSVVKAEKPALIQADVLQNMNVDNMTTGQIRQAMLDSKLPYLQAFHTLGLEQSQKMLRDYFPQFTKSFIDVIENKRDKDGNVISYGLRSFTKYNTLDAKTINNVYNDLFAYIMTDLDFFGSEMNPSTNKVTTKADRRYSFINTFPMEFQRVIENNPEIAELDFIKRLSPVKGGSKNPVDTLVFSNVGKLSPQLKERYTRDWQSLLYMGPEGAQLAVNLFRYSFFRNGFAFGPNTFIHFAPLAIREVIPGYLDKLRELTSSSDNYDDFIEQYIYNHLDNRQLVPEVSIKDTQVESVSDENGIKESITISFEEEAPVGAEKKWIKDTIDMGGFEAYNFIPYFTAKENGQNYYYKLVTGGEGSTSGTYERITPLGHPNSFIEYEYGKKASEIVSQIKQKDTVNENDLLESGIYDNFDVTKEEAPVYDDAMYISLALSEAYKEVTGIELDITEKVNNSDESFAPNKDFKDANDKPLCV